MERSDEPNIQAELAEEAEFFEAMKRAGDRLLDLAPFRDAFRRTIVRSMILRHLEAMRAGTEPPEFTLDDVPQVTQYLTLAGVRVVFDDLEALGVVVRRGSAESQSSWTYRYDPAQLESLGGTGIEDKRLDGPYSSTAPLN